MSSGSSSPKRTKVLKKDDSNQQINSEALALLAISDLSELQKKLKVLEENELKDILQAKLAIHEKYNKLRVPHYEGRANVIQNIPNFWATAIFNHPKIGTLVTEEEKNILSFLIKLKVEEFENVKSGFRVKFIFEENPFFENQELIKELNFETQTKLKSTSTIINWKAHPEQSKKQPRMAEDKIKTSSGGERTFFSWLAENRHHTTTDDIAEVIKVDLWHNPLNYYVTTCTAAVQAAGANSLSGLCDESWLPGGIPLELLVKILKNLVENGDGYELPQIKQTLLNARRVHPKWTSEMRKILEEACLQTWKRLELSPFSACEADHALNLSNILVSQTQQEDVIDTLFCPVQLWELGEIGVNPFPTKSLKLAYPKQSDADSFSKHRGNTYISMNVIPFFNKVGHHLSSLVLSNLTLTPLKLQEILQGVPQVKALTLNRVNIKVILPECPEFDSSSYEFPELPPLPGLRHIRLYNTVANDEEKDCELNTRDWILPPYQEQFETIDLDTGSVCWELLYKMRLEGKRHTKICVLGDTSTSFPKLKILTAWDTEICRLIKLPEQIQCLSMVAEKHFSNYADVDNTLEYLQLVLAPFADKLVQLHLCISVRRRIWNNYWIKRVRDESVSMKDDPERYHCTEFTWLTTGITFSKLKTFSIPVSMVLNENEAVKNMLKCFPLLEIINLMIDHEDYLPEQKKIPPTEDEINSIKEMVLQLASWGCLTCPKLKKITLRLQLSERNGFLLEHLIR